MSNEIEEVVLTQKQLDYISDADYIKEYGGNLPCCDHVVPVEYHSMNADIFLYGKPVNWKDDFRFHTQVISLLIENKINEIYFPDIAGFTGEICGASDFINHFSIKKFGLELFLHKKTEGLVIPKNAAAFLCTADCPIVVYHDFTNDIVIAAHAGLGSVIDRKRAITGIPSRYRESVVSSLMKHTRKTDNYEIRIIGGINAESFRYSINDTQYGNNNNKILNHLIHNYGRDTVPFGIDHGGISIPAIIKKQLINFYQIDPGKIYVDGIDTFSDKRFWSHAEFVKNGGKDGRNGTLVIHK